MSAPCHALRRARWRWPRWLIAVWLAAAGACGPALNYPYDQEPDPRALDYIIDESDQLKIRVWSMPELGAEVLVRPDGVVTLPLVGEVKAAGLTPKALRDKLSELYARYLKDTNIDITITVTDPTAYRISVLGNVERPGAIISKFHITLAEAVTMAGGLNKFAAPRRMAILRRDAKKGYRRIPIDFDRVRFGDHPKENLTLAPGDIVVVR